MKITISKSQWQEMGRKAGWNPMDPLEYSDRDIDPATNPESEETQIMGEEETDPNYAYKDGYKYGKGGRGKDENPYRTDTENGLMKWKQWATGYDDGENQQSPKF